MTSIPTVRHPSSATTTRLVALYRYIEDVRTQNSALDDALRDELARVPEDRWHDLDTDIRRTVAEQVGHVAESSNFIASQLESWTAGHRAVMGRRGPGDADFQNGLARAADTNSATLRADLDNALARLGNLLLSFRDVHLHATLEHVTYGREPLGLVLVRDILAHKQRHIDELAMTACLLRTAP